MLKESLLEWCQTEYDSSKAGSCDSHCNNEDHCQHDCDICLAQVHWYPQYDGRSDYNCPNLLLKYVLRFTEKYSQQIYDALNLIDTSCYHCYNIFSIGCGAAPDLMAFEEITKSENKTIYYRGFDRNTLWEPIHYRIEQYCEQSETIEAKLDCFDIFDVLLKDKHAQKQYNVVVIQYLLSHLYNTKQSCKISLLFDNIIECIISQKASDSPFLIIITDVDSCYKGRNTWFTFLDKLESAGLCGRAFARSAYPSGDLGQKRWSHHKQSTCFGNIAYEYKQNESDSNGAQLVIELR